ncbi:MAG: MiaB/RimO family radical SAM methylthiotransferase [Treponema sp.]
MLIKHFFLDQHGCAKNQVDGELLIGVLQTLGWKRVDNPENAALIIVNSCGFIEPAKVESINAVIAARRDFPHAKIVLAGCLAERYGQEMQQEFVEADAFFGNGDISRISEVLQALFPSNYVVTDTNTPEHTTRSDVNTLVIDAPQASYKRIFVKPPQVGVCCGDRPEILNFPRSAFIKITEGCNNCCTFCAIPLIRGTVRSRSIANIIEEMQSFIKKGYKEFNLIGQDLAAFEAAFDGSGSALAQLLRHISLLDGHFWVRLLYIHPDHFPLDILPIMVADTRFLPYFDIPFQSGSERIIHAMNRRGNAERYLKLVHTIREAFCAGNSPYRRAVIRTTFLTGFPTETAAEAQETELFLQNLEPLWAGSFMYSAEEDTQAASMQPKISARTAKKRSERLKMLQMPITQKLLASFCGETLLVLIEELIPKETDDVYETRIALGRAWFQAPEVDGSIVVNYEDTQTDTDGEPIAAGSLVLVRMGTVHGVDIEAYAL